MTATTNARRASPPRTPPTIAPVLFDGLGVAFESVDDEGEAEEKIDVIGMGDDEVGVEAMIELIDDVVAEDVEDADMTDGFALLRAEVVDVLKSSEIVVGENSKLSVIAAVPQAM